MVEPASIHFLLSKEKISNQLIDVAFIAL